MKKMIVALGLAAALTSLGAMSVSADRTWEYNDTMTIDMSLTDLKKTDDGHEILEFVGIEKLDDEGGTCTYTYVYDRTAGTIQVKEMEKKTKKLHYTSNFAPESINSSNPVIRERAAMAEAVYQKKVNKD
jgi:hypothetical protein